jgi:hypothetical protein
MMLKELEFVWQGPNLHLLYQHLTMQRLERRACAGTGFPVVD